MPDRYIPGVPCWYDLMPPDVDAAATFYGQLFGWDLQDLIPADVPARYLNATKDGKVVGAIGTPDEGLEPQTAWRNYVWVEDVDATLKKAWSAGGTVLHEPFVVEGAGRWALFADPQGAQIAIWESYGHPGAEGVNADGTVNFTTLHTNDRDAAAAFYGAVFGWEVLDLGDDDVSYWALPGYGDHLDTLNPGFLKMMQDMGAPAGFEHVVAAIGPLEAGDAPHWGITFGVDDCDAATARATELGATVLAGPFDAPWVRMSVLRDPQGTVFTASQFVPPAPDGAQADAQAAAA